MKSQFMTSQLADPALRRRGATLTEVLIAILIMGIGLVGVISMFPAAILRSVHGNTLTVGTGVRFNAESMLRIHPELLLDPDRNLAAEPAPFLATDRDHNGFRYDDQAFSAFMVDPLGIINHVVADGSPVCSVPGGQSRIQRLSAGFTTVATAEEVFSGLDQWITQFEDIPINGSLDPTAASQSLTFGDLSQKGVFFGAGLAPTRLVIFNRAGTGCQIRELTPPATSTQLTNTVTWNGSNLPGAYSNATFANADVGNVRVEQRDLRFTWLMTARGQTSSSTVATGEFIYDVDVVVFFKRGYPPGDIVGYTNTSGAPNLVFKQNSVDVVLNWDPATTAAPFLKRGNFVMDAQNGYWYRIENYIEGADLATITLATPARANSEVAVFMKGIVDVFPVRQVTITNPLK